MDYRKYYEKITGLKIKKGNEVHHIDCNRANNEIMNLISLPKDVHRRLHVVINNYKIATNNIDEFGYFYNKEKTGILVAISCYLDMKSELWNYLLNRNNLIINNNINNG